MSTKYPGGIIPAAPSYSMLTTGTGYLQINGSSAFVIPTANTPFTVECWIYLLASGTNVMFSEQVTGPGNTSPLACSLATAVDVGTPGGLRPAFGWYNGTAWTTAAATDAVNAISLRQWTHLAFVFTGSTCKIYKNGIDVTSATPTPQTSWGVTTVNGEVWYVGRRWDGAIGFNGYISNFRFVVGTAIYTTNFTPPGFLNNIPNTVLLTAQYNTLRDGSSNNFYTQPILGATASDFTPFSTPVGYNPAVGFNPALGGTANGVWTLDQVTNAQQSNTWPAYDLNYNQTTLMLNCNGANNATNKNFIDSGPNNFTISTPGPGTLQGQGTFSPFSKNGWAVKFDPTGINYYTIANTATPLQMGTGDFTFETWILWDGSTGTRYIWSRGATGAGWQVTFNGTTSNVIFTINAQSVTGSIAVIRNVWTHVACVRAGTAVNNMRMYINGVLAGSSVAANVDNLNQANASQIGMAPGTPAATSTWGGLMSNLRVVKGTAVYTTNFTPPTAPLTEVSGTALLTFQYSTVVDNRSQKLALTRTSTNTGGANVSYLGIGGIAIVPQSPFLKNAIYNPLVNAGSLMCAIGPHTIAFGTGSAALAIGASTDFTLEFFFYSKGSSIGAATIFSVTSPGVSFIVNKIVNSNLSYTYGTATGVIATEAALNLASDQWNHIAICREAGTINAFFNGIIASSVVNAQAFGTPNTNVIVGIGSAIDNWMSGLRMVIGSSVYTGIKFVVPTAPLTAITNTAYLLNFSNAGIIDYGSNSGANFGGAVITTAQSKWGFGSLLCSRGLGVQNGMSIPTCENIELLGTSNYTIELWVYPLNFTVTEGYIVAKDAVSGTNYPQYSIRINTTGNVLYSVGIASGAVTVQTITSTGVLIVNAWNHVAVTKYNSVLTIFINGIPSISATQTVTPVYVGRPLLINGQANGGALGGIDGYINDLRITKGYARYTNTEQVQALTANSSGSFQPPTSALQGQ